MIGLYGEEIKDYVFESAFEFDQKEILHYKLYDFVSRKPTHEGSHSKLNIEDKILNTFL